MTTSWVIRETATGRVIMETFDAKKVAALNTARYQAVPIQQYLAELTPAAGPEPGQCRQPGDPTMKTQTFTLLVTVRDDGCAAVFNPVILAAAVKGALETGIDSFMLDSDQARAVNAKPGMHHLEPVVVAEVSAFHGDRLECKPGTVGHSAANGSGAAKRLHAELRKD